MATKCVERDPLAVLIRQAEARHLFAFFHARIPLCGSGWCVFRLRDIDIFATDFFHMIAKRVLAAEFGATSETLSRTLAKFRDRRLLQVKGDTLIVKRPDQLQKLLRQHLGELQ